MKTKILTVIAVLLAIPTYGISIFVWIFIKYQYDKFFATKVLINAIVISYSKNGATEVRYGVNNAALPIVFDYFGGKIFTDYGNSINGALPHPSTGDFMIVTMRQAPHNRLLIKSEKPQILKRVY